jgi:hypothetical protein
LASISTHFFSMSAALAEYVDMGSSVKREIGPPGPTNEGGFYTARLPPSTPIISVLPSKNKVLENRYDRTSV